MITIDQLSSEQIAYLHESVLTLQPLKAGGQWAGHTCREDSFADTLMQRLAGSIPGSDTYGAKNALTFASRDGTTHFAVEQIDTDLEPDIAEGPKWDFAAGIQWPFIATRINLVTVRRLLCASTLQKN